MSGVVAGCDRAANPKDEPEDSEKSSYSGGTAAKDLKGCDSLTREEGYWIELLLSAGEEGRHFTGVARDGATLAIEQPPGAPAALPEIV